MFYKIDVLKTLAIFTGKHLRWILFLIKLQTPEKKKEPWQKKRPWQIEKETLAQVFSVNSAKFLRTPFFIEQF